MYIREQAVTGGGENVHALHFLRGAETPLARRYIVCNQMTCHVHYIHLARRRHCCKTVVLLKPS